MTSELAASERAADIGLRQRTPGWRHDARALGQATRCQRNVGGHADIAVGDALAIQSSAASARSPTRIIWTFGKPGGRNGRDPFHTTKTVRRSLVATRYTSSRTGQASAST